MKKFLTIILTTALLASLSACGDNKDSSVTPDAPEVSTSAETDTAQETTAAAETTNASAVSTAQSSTAAAESSTASAETTTENTETSSEPQEFEGAFNSEPDGEEVDTEEFTDIKMNLNIVDYTEVPGCQKLTFPEEEIGGEIFSFATDGTTLWLDVLSESVQKIIAYDIASGSSREIYSNTDMNKDIPFQLSYSGGKLIGTYVHVETQTTYLATIDPESGESKLLYEIGEGGVYESLPDKLTVQHFITEVDEEGRFYGFPEYEITQIDPQTGASKLIYTGKTYDYTGEYYDYENPTDGLIGYVENYPDGVAIMEGYADNESYESFLTIHTDEYTISPDEANFQYFAGDKSCAIFGCHRNNETPLTLYTYDIEKRQRIIMDISGLPMMSTPVGRNFVLHNGDEKLKGWFYVIPILGMAVRLEPTPVMIVNTATGGGMTAISCYTFDQKNSDTIYLFNK
ncbi:MAG: hypothetical protein J6L99_00855 [Ruminococcus sp.]|nr:hypothetical protein [Ruminococcus sp.]